MFEKSFVVSMIAGSGIVTILTIGLFGEVVSLKNSILGMGVIGVNSIAGMICVAKC
jgi:hypothetical protein